MSDGRALVLVTGSNGFIGRALVSSLAPSYCVVALDRSCTPEAPAGVECEEIDLTSDESCAPHCSKWAPVMVPGSPP